MSVTTRPFGYPLEEITLATWFPKLDVLLVPEFTGAEVRVDFSADTERCASISIVLHPDTLNAYTNHSVERSYSLGSLSADGISVSSSSESELPYSALVADTKSLGYARETETPYPSIVKIFDPRVTFSASLNNGPPEKLPHKIFSFRAQRTITKDVRTITIDASLDKRKHITYDTVG